MPFESGLITIDDNSDEENASGDFVPGTGGEAAAGRPQTPQRDRFCFVWRRTGEGLIGKYFSVDCGRDLDVVR
jgi:hypothetical protein